MKLNLPSLTAQARMKSKYSIEKNSAVGENIVSGQQVIFPAEVKCIIDIVLFFNGVILFSR